MKVRANKRLTWKGKFREAVHLAARMYSSIGNHHAKRAKNHKLVYWRDNIQRFIIQKFGLEIKQMVYDLENNVTVNQNDMHDKLFFQEGNMEDDPVHIPR
jgi:hypothetical protein